MCSFSALRFERAEGSEEEDKEKVEGPPPKVARLENHFPPLMGAGDKDLAGKRLLFAAS
jgi:hypothetical protein